MGFKTLLSKNIFIYRLFTSYFNLKKIRKSKKNKFSIIKTYISKQEVKHNNSDITIEFSLFDKENTLFKKHIYKVYKKIFYKKDKLEKYKQFNFLYKILKVLDKSKTRSILNKMIYKSFFELKKYSNLFLYKEKIIRLSFNKLKFNILNLLGLKNILNKIYNKKTYINLTNLKYIFLDSNLLTEVLGKKLKNRKNNVLKNIIKITSLVKIPSIIEYEYITKKNKIVYKNILLNRDPDNLIDNNILNFKDLIYIPLQKLSIALYYLKYKTINGIRIQGTGRLTKRLTALRSVSKFKQKGTLKNVYSSAYKMSTVMLTGFIKSNLQYIKKDYNNRNGSYGIKTYISSY